MADDNKARALSAALGQIEKQFGKGSIMKLGDNQAMDIESVSTGSLTIDIALGMGAYLVAAWSKFMVQNHLVKPH